MVGTTELSPQLAPFTTIAYNNYKVCAPKIVKNETYAINIIHVTQEEEKDQKKKNNNKNIHKTGTDAKDIWNHW